MRKKLRTSCPEIVRLKDARIVKKINHSSAAMTGFDEHTKGQKIKVKLRRLTRALFKLESNNYNYATK